ncbi:MAG: class 1 fructose-bisphosphatase [Nitratiruptor sp.]|nr:class 1 fructose-bisphosphatase [Nitratiruptor sp.]NPA84134.1 class 1 fructose-bisphosphatase [Campylobacterota bacterium]
MEKVIEAIQQAAIAIRREIEGVQFDYAKSQNASGEQQLKLDLMSDEIIAHHLAQVPSIKAIASEERSQVQELNPGGAYLIAYDPLDGSSLIDVDLSVGSIFGIYEGAFEGGNLIASVYVVYGPRTELVVAREGVERFILTQGRWIFKESLALGERGKINAPGGTQKGWYPHHKALIQSLFEEGYRLRYSGGMVPDLHQILVKGGGLFSYPGTTDRPQGKLRKLFEVFPFALVFERAGGEAIDDRGRRLLELPCDDLHETTPCFFGSSYEIQRVKTFYQTR